MIETSAFQIFLSGNSTFLSYQYKANGSTN